MSNSLRIIATFAVIGVVFGGALLYLADVSPLSTSPNPIAASPTQEPLPTQVSSPTPTPLDVSNELLERNLTAIDALIKEIHTDGTKRDQILAAADRIQMANDAMIGIITKLQIRVDEHKKAGNEVTSLQSHLIHATANIADAKIYAEAAITKVANLSPASADEASVKEHKKVIKNARADINICAENLHQAYKGINALIGELKKLISSPMPQQSISSSPFTSPSPSPSSS